MKSATIPSLRVEPELLQAAESVLKEGETLSSFVEDAVRSKIQYRQSQQEFIARGLASREDAKRTGIYHPAADVLAMLKAKLDAKLAEQQEK